MKRDMDLIRSILLELEAHPYSLGWCNIEVEGYNDDEISYHVMLLKQAGLIEAQDLSSMSGPEWKPKWLTWPGHEFLDASRDDSRWDKAKKTITEKGGTVTFDILKSLLIDLMKRNIFN